MSPATVCLRVYRCVGRFVERALHDELTIVASMALAMTGAGYALYISMMYGCLTGVLQQCRNELSGVGLTRINWPPPGLNGATGHCVRNQRTQCALHTWLQRPRARIHAYSPGYTCMYVRVVSTWDTAWCQWRRCKNIIQCIDVLSSMITEPKDYNCARGIIRHMHHPWAQLYMAPINNGSNCP